MEYLKINSNDGFLHLNDLPHNCIFNKVVTGCGGTTVALQNEENYVIAVPTTELIVNKIGGVGDRNGVFGLYGEFSYCLKKQLKEFSGNKIMCTYDKVRQLDKYINLSEWRLLVDEYHNLLKAYAYRQKAVDGALNNFRKFKSFCFMSATPISPEFTPLVLSDVPVIEAKWDKVDTMMVKPQQTNKPYVLAANIINKYKRDGFIEVAGKKSREGFFFINSVTEICNIIAHCNLEDGDYRIICADNETNRKQLSKVTDKQIENSKSPSRLITFITSKSFEGVDYFSETGMCYVVSNTSNKNTLLDISTDIFQIAGRIRTKSNPFRNLLVHIFNSQGGRDLELNCTYEEICNKVDREVKITNELINFVNNYEEEDRKIAKKKLNPEYIYEEDGIIKLNDMVIKLELYTYKLEQVIYNNGVSIVKAYDDEGIITTELSYEQIKEVMSKAVKKETFEEEFKRYCQRGEFNLEDDSTYSELCKNAYKLLGPDKVRKLRYTKSSIQAALDNLDKTKSNEQKVAQAIVKEIKIGFISSKEAKEIIKKIFKDYQILDTPKASLLSRWFNCEEISKRIDKSVVKGYNIYSPKFIISPE